MRQIFVPGGQPNYTYVERKELSLEEQLLNSCDNLCKLVTVTGPTKSGKTVVTKKVFPPEHSIWINGGSIEVENDLWTQIVERMDGYTEAVKSSTKKSEGKLKTSASGSAGLPLFVHAKIELSPEISSGSEKSETVSRKSSPKSKALEVLKKSRKPLIIDDFHYLERQIQGSVVRALKELVFEGHPVILLAIPHRRYDAIRVEKEMTGRVCQISMPPWPSEDLRKIPEIGFPLLKVKIHEGIINYLSKECIGSPHLMQEFCRRICEVNGIQEVLPTERNVQLEKGGEDIFKAVAQGTSKIIFDRLAKGPRQRTDRTKRHFKDGRTGDIYFAVLQAIAQLKPGMDRIEYEQIREKLKELLVKLPQANEVSRVLEQMSKIQSTEESSAPVLDWDKPERQLHITDPFFAFFLRWGIDQ